MLNTYLYAWLQLNSIARGLKNSIAIVFHTPKELKGPKKSSNTDIILMIPDNLSHLTAIGEASYRTRSLSQWMLVLAFIYV